MKLRFKVNQIAIAALLSVSIVTLSAVFSKYPGLIELQCNPGGCHVVIDGRPSNDLDDNNNPRGAPYTISETCEQQQQNNIELETEDTDHTILASHEKSNESSPCE